MSSRFGDLVRAIATAPEWLALFGVFLGLMVFPDVAEFVAELFLGDLKWGAGAISLSVGLVVVCYQISTDLLSPAGGRRILLDWPEYWMLKQRVLLALMFCALAVLISSVGLYVLARYSALLGAAMIVAALCMGGTAVCVVALGKWKSRELLGE